MLVKWFKPYTLLVLCCNQPQWLQCNTWSVQKVMKLLVWTKVIGKIFKFRCNPLQNQHTAGSLAVLSGSCWLSQNDVLKPIKYFSMGISLTVWPWGTKSLCSTPQWSQNRLTLTWFLICTFLLSLGMAVTSLPLFTTVCCVGVKLKTPASITCYHSLKKLWLIWKMVQGVQTNTLEVSFGSEVGFLSTVLAPTAIELSAIAPCLLLSSSAISLTVTHHILCTLHVFLFLPWQVLLCTVHLQLFPALPESPCAIEKLALGINLGLHKKFLNFLYASVILLCSWSKIQRHNIA